MTYPFTGGYKYALIEIHALWNEFSLQMYEYLLIHLTVKTQSVILWPYLLSRLTPAFERGFHIYASRQLLINELDNNYEK